jgi:hypothetical protein
LGVGAGAVAGPAVLESGVSANEITHYFQPPECKVASST